jgi:hypothetical protein
LSLAFPRERSRFRVSVAIMEHGDRRTIRFWQVL